MANETYLIVPIFLLALVGIFNSLLFIGSFTSNSLSGYTSQAPVVNINVPVIGSIVNPIANWLVSFVVQNFMVTAVLGLVGIVALGIGLAFIGTRIQAQGTVIASGIGGSIGLSDVSVMILYKSIIFLAIWCIFSLLAVSAINSFPLFLGWVFYLIISGLYTIGVLSQIGHM
jgi:hypothetical protein